MNELKQKLIDEFTGYLNHAEECSEGIDGFIRYLDGNFTSIEIDGKTIFINTYVR